MFMNFTRIQGLGEEQLLLQPPDGLDATLQTFLRASDMYKAGSTPEALYYLFILDLCSVVKKKLFTHAQRHSYVSRFSPGIH